MGKRAEGGTPSTSVGGSLPLSRALKLFPIIGEELAATGKVGRHPSGAGTLWKSVLIGSERREGLLLLSEESLKWPEYLSRVNGDQAVGGADGVVSGGGLPLERTWGRCPGVEEVFPDFAAVAEMSLGGIYQTSF